MPELAQRMRRVRPVVTLARLLNAQGRDSIRFPVGEPRSLRIRYTRPAVPLAPGKARIQAFFAELT
ncbi:MAG TPA: hypothetical protein VF271_04820 [Rhodanobacteraceae bacterium]